MSDDGGKVIEFRPRTAPAKEAVAESLVEPGDPMLEMSRVGELVEFKVTQGDKQYILHLTPIAAIQISNSLGGVALSILTEPPDDGDTSA